MSQSLVLILKFSESLRHELELKQSGLTWRRGLNEVRHYYNISYFERMKCPWLKIQAYILNLFGTLRKLYVPLNFMHTE